MKYHERKLLIEDVLEAIGNHTALKLAGVEGHALHQALGSRIGEVEGMLEVVRRLPEYAPMVAYLRSHRDWLVAKRQELEGA